MKNIRFYWITIIFGLLLSIYSLSPLVLLTMEIIYRTYVNDRYQIVNEYKQLLEQNIADDPYQPDLPVSYTSGENEIDAMIVPKKKITPTIFAGDVDLYVNGKFLGIIWNRLLRSDYPDTKEEPVKFDLRNADDVEIYTLHDTYTDQKDIIIFADITAYQVKAGEEYLHHRYYPKEMEEMSSFQYWRIHQDGTSEKVVFRQKGKRTFLQTYLASHAGVPIGHFTSIFYAYPSFFFPIVYPIITAILGIFLVLCGIKSRRTKLHKV